MQLHYLAGYSLIGLLGSGWLSVIVNLTLILLILGFVAAVILEGLDNLRGIRQPKVFEIIIPTGDIGHPDSDSLFIVLSNLISQLEAKYWLLRQKNRLSFEINLTKDRGLRLIAVVPKHLSDNFKSSLLSYNPRLKLNALKSLDYINSIGDNTKYSEFVPSINPLHDISDIKDFDSLSYFSEAALNLSDSDSVSLQAVIQTPNNLLIVKKSASSLETLALALNKLSHFIFGLFINYPLKQTTTETKTESTTYFRGSLRLVSNLESPDRAKLLSAAMSPYKLKPKSMLKSPVFRGFNLYKYKHHSTSINPFNNIWLKGGTLSHIFGWQNVQTEPINLGISFNKELALPFGINNRAKFDISLGINNYHGETRPLGLSHEERQRHLLILGGTGNGKTTMMIYAIKQDIRNGKGVAIIDPHGDLAETVLKFVPKARLKDVVYFNPSDISHPLGLNLLELPKGIAGDELLLAQDFVTESVISILRKLFNGGETGGHRLEYILRNAIQTAFTVENANIFTVYRLLSDDKYRLNATSNLKDKSLKNFWDNEYSKAGNMQRVKLSIGVTSKLGRFLRSAATRRVLVQPKSSIDFEELINSGKILICNFSKGKIGEDTSSLLGSAVMAKLQLAAYARQNLSEDMRSDFYLYIDEFQNFANSSFAQLLSEARKYKLYLTLAEQSLSQQADQNLISTILANVGSLVCFRCSSPNDVALLLPIFGENLNSYDLLNLDAYHFYMRIAAIKSYPVFSGETVILTNPKVDYVEEIIAYSQGRYGWSKA